MAATRTPFWVEPVTRLLEEAALAMHAGCMHTPGIVTSKPLYPTPHSGCEGSKEIGSAWTEMTTFCISDI